MKREKSPLDHVEVASPCSAAWEQMIGDERVRFCDLCALNVYNLSAMGRKEAEELVRAHEGRLCIRFYRRRDGTLLTDNCPVGLRRARARLKILAGAAASVLAAIFGLRPAHAPTRAVAGRMMPGRAPHQGKAKVIQIDPPRMYMGAMAAPPAPKSGR